MKTDIVVNAEARESRGKNEARRLRARGMAPAVVYGANEAATAVAVSPKEVTKILRSKSGHNTIFQLAIGGASASTPVMIVDWQTDPVKDTLLHIDLKRIDLTKRIAVKIPVHTVGDAQGVKLQGGLFEVITREVEIECLPDEIPEQFEVNVSGLMLGQNVRASEIPLTGSMKLLSAPELVLAHVVSMKAEEVAAEAEPAVAAVAEPEVIKKGKKEEEAAPAEEKGKKK
ncbi:MAG TPA: 50S ribosomal protein L25 [Bryobacteraceae bacterium]|nr:50S ribosomal protein L25 [Bryobacteraceae bacterium]